MNHGRYRESDRLRSANTGNAACDAKGRGLARRSEVRAAPQAQSGLKKKVGARAAGFYRNAAAWGAFAAFGERLGSGQTSNGGSATNAAPIGGGIVNAAPGSPGDVPSKPNYIPGGKVQP